MTGTRIYQSDGEDFLLRISEVPGSYGKFTNPHNGVVSWYCCTPNAHLGNLAAHQVVEHDDGTITVSPSILVSGGPGCKTELWHGYLERGEWRAC